MDVKKYWLEDPLVLFKDLDTVVPTPTMSPADTHNTVVRAAMYVAVFLALIFSNNQFLYLILVVMGLSVLVFYYRRRETFKQEKLLLDRQLDVVENKLCARSTVENPFMNVLVTDYEDRPERPSACPVDHPVVAPVVDTHFEARLFKDVGDVFGNMHSQRQFYTMPNTAIPNDQGAFAQWLYGSPEPSCKEGNGTQCLRNIHTPIVHL